MVKNYIEKSLANYFNAYKKANSTLERSNFVLSGFIAIAFFTNFLVFLLFMERVFGVPLATLYDSVFSNGLSAVIPPMIIFWSISYYCIKRLNIQRKVCEKYSCAEGYKFMFFWGTLFIPVLIMAILIEFV